MSMQDELPSEVSQITGHLSGELRKVLGDRLLAVYLFGSATTGAYKQGISDVDVVAVLASDPSNEDVVALAAMHEQLANESPDWNDRIEVDYLSTKALAEFRSHPWPAARISPGEPFHRIEIDHQWVLDWYQVRNSGIALYGPPPETLVPPISQTEFVGAVREQLLKWPDRISRASSAGGLAYAVLTVCRAFRACRTGEYVSKTDAAFWASEELPKFRGLIEDAVSWRHSAATEARKPPDREAARRLCQDVLHLCSLVS